MNRKTFMIGIILLVLMVLIGYLIKKNKKELPQDFPQTTVKVLNDSISLGKISQESKAEATFKIKNIGKELLLIKEVRSSCGCTSVNYMKAPIKVGDIATVTLQYDTKRIGYFYKTATVFCNTDKPIVLRIIGEVIE